MISYKVEYSCVGYTTSYYEIHMLFNDIIVGCIYYIEDSLKSCNPEVQFDKWHKYKKYENQISTINPLKVAQDALLEHYLL